MAKKPIPSPEELRQLLRYEPKTGKLFWLRRPRSMFLSDWSFKCWNTRWEGKEAITANSRGYRVGNVLGTVIPAHRIAWAIHYGAWPKEEIDHINRVKNDNRIENLREANRFENLYNIRVREGTRTGIKGVDFHKASGKYRARINAKGVNYWIGSFDTVEEASKAREEAAHRMHGEFANHSCSSG